jgi:hypothetical protein
MPVDRIERDFFNQRWIIDIAGAFTRFDTGHRRRVLSGTGFNNSGPPLRRSATARNPSAR